MKIIEKLLQFKGLNLVTDPHWFLVSLFFLLLFFLIQTDKPTLSNINMDISVGSLVAIVGGTGEGKTSLTSAMLGEIPVVSNESNVIVRGSVSYVPQISWIFNATVSLIFFFFFFFNLFGWSHTFRQELCCIHINFLKLFSQVRENILFGSEFEPARYWKAIDVTELLHDLDLLPVKLIYDVYDF